MIFTQPSINNLFIEWALPVGAFKPGFRQGLYASRYGDNMTITGDIFVPGTQANQQGKLPLGSTLRLTVDPIHEKKKVLHFGLTNWHQDTDNTETIGFGTVPEAFDRYRPAPTKLVKTGKIQNVDDFNVTELEGAIMYHQLSSQIELFNNYVRRNEHNDHNKHLNFQGLTANIAYFITGESMEYNFKKGFFNGISEINNKMGALQFTARYSLIDLNDGDINGGIENDYTLGLNWYVNKNIKVMANYIRVNVKHSRANDGNSNILNLRCQLFV